MTGDDKKSSEAIGFILSFALANQVTLQIFSPINGSLDLAKEKCKRYNFMKQFYSRVKVVISFGIFGNGHAIWKRSLGDADILSKG